MSSAIPDTEVGRQLRWLVEAVRRLPISVPDLEMHLAPALLARLPPDRLNAVFARAGATATTRFVAVVTATPTSIEATVDPGSGGPPLVVSLAADGDGRIAELAVRPIALTPRADRGLPPLSLPQPTGPSAVGTVTVVVTDDARGGRRIPVQLWYPAVGIDPGAGPALYAPPGTSAALAEELAVPVGDVGAIRTHATSAPRPATGGDRLPLVLFSPGLGVTRPFYSGLAADLASHGYVAAVLDHPGNGALVELPDGPPMEAVDQSEDDLRAARVADLRAVLDELQRLDADPGCRLHDALDLDTVALAGHAQGGAAAAEAMRIDDRFRAGIDLDGPLYGEVVGTGLDRPFLLVSSDRPDQAEDDTWTSFRAQSPAALSLLVAGTGPMSFSDWPTLASFRPPDEPRQSFDIGTIDPNRSFAVQSAVVVAFLDTHVRGIPAPLLDGPSPEYPEVRFR